MTQSPTPIAIVGFGKIARDQHVPSIGRTPDFALAASVSRNARAEGVDHFSSLTEMLDARPDIGAVALCMPPQVRFGYAVEALSAGRHVLLEKPPGASVAEVASLARLADAAGVTLYASWHSRHAAQVPAARAWMATRQVRRVTITWREDVRHWHPGQQWIWQAGGLGVFDPGINALSILTEILPEPVHVTEAELDFPANRDTPIAARLTMAGATGLRVAVDLDWRQTGPQTWNIAVETDGSTLLLSEGGDVATLDGADWAAPEPAATEYDGVYARFAKLIAARRSDVDVAPLRHVADAFMLGKRVVTDPFED